MGNWGVCHAPDAAPSTGRHGLARRGPAAAGPAMAAAVRTSPRRALSAVSAGRHWGAWGVGDAGRPERPGPTPEPATRPAARRRRRGRPRVGAGVWVGGAAGI